MKDTKTFAEDLVFFSKTYTDEIVLKIVEYAPEIAKNEVLVDLLHEAHVRADEDEATMARHSCLKNAKSYHDVCRDLIWKIIGEED